MADIVGQNQLSAVGCVAALVAKHREVRSILDEAAPVVANRHAQRNAHKDSVERSVGHEEDAPLTFRLGLGFGRGST